MFNKIVMLIEDINVTEVKKFILEKETLLKNIDEVIEWLSLEK